mgnify:CR=1 FL=1
MKRDKAEQYVWQITELYDMSDEDGAVDLLNEYANKRVIEELESVLNRTDEGYIFEEHLIERIQQLKQD